LPPRAYADRLVGIYWQHIYPIESCLDRELFFRNYDAFSNVWIWWSGRPTSWLVSEVGWVCWPGLREDCGLPSCAKNLLSACHPLLCARSLDNLRRPESSSVDGVAAVLPGLSARPAPTTSDIRD
jgi:hypothetical protein